MNRDLSEGLESAIISSRGLKQIVDPIDGGLNRVFGSGALRPVKLLLNGSWLGHPLHPLLTDVPVGAWTAALLLDLLALVFHLPTGRAASAAVGLGIAAALAAAAAGLMDWI